jgi:murein L,D-transpeptidase YcbB/YkuD
VEAVQVRLRRTAAAFFAAAILSLSSGARADLQWPLDGRTVGESTDLIHHLTALARDVQVAGERLREPDLLVRFYMARNFRPGWFDREGVYLESEDLLQALRQAELDALAPHGYHLAALEKQLGKPLESAVELAQLDLLLTDAFFHYARRLRYGEVPTTWEMHLRRAPEAALIDALERGLSDHRLVRVLDEQAPPYRGYRRLRLMLARYRAVQRRGGWPVVQGGPMLRRGSQGERVKRLRWRLVASGDIPDRNTRNEAYFDRALEKAVRRFQRRHGLVPDGRVGGRTLQVLNVPVAERIRQLRLNMERWRWLPRELGERYIIVNSAAFELGIYEKGQPLRKMRVIVGRRSRQTPGMVSHIDKLVINPYWYVPETVVGDLLPKLKRDPGLLSRKGLRVFSDLQGAGREVDPTHVKWSRYGETGKPFPYTLRQDPGPGNALGQVKFLFPNEQGIYLHDTPAQYLFKRHERALSSGCVRLDEPLTLARYLLSTNGWSPQRFEKVLQSGKPTPVALEAPVPVVLGYWTAWVNGVNELHFQDDRYHRDARIAAALR